MFTQIEPNHKNTREFLQYVVGEITRQYSLRPGKPAEVLISENSTPFPKVIQISGEEGYKEMKKLDLLGVQVPSSYSLGMRDFNGREIALDNNMLKHYRMEIAISYIQEKLSGMCVLKNEPVNIDGSSSFIALIDVTNPDKLKQENDKIESLTLKWDGLFQNKNADLIQILPQIYYDKNTGIGYINDRRFKFKNNQPEFFIFAEMYKHINKPLSRNKVLELAKYKNNKSAALEYLTKNTKRKINSNTGITYFINNLAKKMRKRTNLNTDHIANNNGDLTLSGKKTKNPPK